MPIVSISILISLLYARSRLSDYLDNLFVEKGSPVLDRENDVIMNLPCTVVPFFDSPFIVHLCSITKSPCSKLQGTLKLDIPLSPVLYRNPQNPVIPGIFQVKPPFITIVGFSVPHEVVSPYCNTAGY